MQGREGGIECHIGTGRSYVAWIHSDRDHTRKGDPKYLCNIDTTKYLHEKSCNVRVINLLFSPGLAMLLTISY